MSFTPILSGTNGAGEPIYRCPKCGQTSATSAQFQRDSSVRGKGGAMVECGRERCLHHAREVEFITTSALAGAKK